MLDQDKERLGSTNEDETEKSLVENILLCDRMLKISNTPSGTNGSTALVLFLREHTAYILNVGDSRAVLGTKQEADGGKWTTTVLNIEHKPDHPMEKKRVEMHGGKVSKASHREGPARIWLDEAGPGLAMSRAVGDHAACRLGVIATPDVTRLHLTTEDKIIILATDGLWEMVNSNEAVEIVSGYNDATQASRALITEATRRWNSIEGDYRDDITCIVAFLPFLPHLVHAATTRSSSFKKHEAQRGMNDKRISFSSHVAVSEAPQVNSPTSRVADPMKYEQAIQEARALNSGRVVEENKHARSWSAPDLVDVAMMQQRGYAAQKRGTKFAAAGSESAAKSSQPLAAKIREEVAQAGGAGADGGLSEAQQKAMARRAKYKRFASSPATLRPAESKVSSYGVSQELEGDLGNFIASMEQEKTLNTFMKRKEGKVTDNFIEVGRACLPPARTQCNTRSPRFAPAERNGNGVRSRRRAREGQTAQAAPPAAERGARRRRRAREQVRARQEHHRGQQGGGRAPNHVQAERVHLARVPVGAWMAWVIASPSRPTQSCCRKDFGVQLDIEL